MSLRRWAPAVLVAALLALPASLAAADSFTPVRVSVIVAPVARLRVALNVKATVGADPGVLDTSDRPIRIEVKLAQECGGSFQTTPGVTLLNKPLSPQPATGKGYSGSASGSGKPSAYGIQSLCVYVEDSGVGRVYGNDESQQVDVSPACTTAGRHYDSAQKALRSSQRQLRRAKGKAARRRLKRTVAARQRTLNRDRGSGRKACGSGVPL